MCGITGWIDWQDDLTASKVRPSETQSRVSQGGLIGKMILLVKKPFSLI
jgi:hypothetical protein